MEGTYSVVDDEGHEKQQEGEFGWTTAGVRVTVSCLEMLLGVKGF